MTIINLTADVPALLAEAPERGDHSVRIVPAGRIIVGSGDDLRTAGTMVEAGQPFTVNTSKALYAVALDGDASVEVGTGFGLREVVPAVKPDPEEERRNADGVIIRDLGDCPALNS